MTKEKTKTELKGMLRKDCLNDTATLNNFHVLEDDSIELFHWLMSVSSNMSYYDRNDKENGKFSSLWENHVLTVLIEIVHKNIGEYVDSFVDGHGTSVQQDYIDNLMEKFTEWGSRLEKYIHLSQNANTDSNAVKVARLLLERLRTAQTQTDKEYSKKTARYMDDTNSPYFRMLGAVADIQKNSGDYIARIKSSGDMDASLTLLLTFIHNYCSITERFNHRINGWADFYRCNILHNTLKPAIQDSTYIVITPNREKIQTTYSLPAGTAFMAGKKTDGTDLHYKSTEKAYIIPAHIHTIRTIFRKNNHLYQSPKISGKSYTHQLSFDDTLDAAPLEYGWLIASHSLVLSEGKRTVSVRFNLNITGDSMLPALSALAGNPESFILQTSNEKGWITQDHTAAYDSYTKSLIFHFTIKEGEKALTVCTNVPHGINTKQPAIRILFADRKQLDTLPKGIFIQDITIYTDVEGIRNFTLMGESGQADPSQPIYPFGPLGERDTQLIFSHEEAALKDVTSVSLKGVWSKLPQNGFEPIYRDYGTDTPITDRSFTACCEWQENGRWHKCPNSPLPLFSKDIDGKLSEDATFKLSLYEKDANFDTCSMPYRRDQKGFYRLILTGPDIGFGMNAYYRRFSDVMIYNSRAKEKDRLPVPEMPKVPMLSDITFGYKSEEILHPGKEGDSVFLLAGICGYEEYTERNDIKRFLPDHDAPSLILGMDQMGDTADIRLYFNLLYNSEKQLPITEQPSGTLSISYYLGKGIWQEYTKDQLVCEETEGLTRSGFIEIKTKAAYPADSLWLRFSFNSGKAPANITSDGIYTNCLRVIAVDGNGNALKAGTISIPSEEDMRISSISQPLPGIGGKTTEMKGDADIRQRIRISTRNRAVCMGDYESLILERFTEIEKVCCVPATTESDSIRIVVFLKPEKKKYNGLTDWKLSEIKEYICAYASPFADIKVINPVYEPILVIFRAILKKNVVNPEDVKRRTERRIREYFMPWYTEGTFPNLGASYSRQALMARIENDECIDSADTVSVIGEHGDWRPSDNDLIYAASNDCGILYVKKVEVKLEKFRSGVETASIGTDFRIG